MKAALKPKPEKQAPAQIPKPQKPQAVVVKKQPKPPTETRQERKVRHALKHGNETKE